MESDATVAATSDRRLKGETDFPAGPPGAENDHFEPLKKQAPPAPAESRSKRRSSRSKSPGHRRRRSRSNSSPDRRRRRFEDRDPRTRGNRRSRSPRPRSPPSRTRGRNRSGSRRRNRSDSRDRFRGRRSRSNGRRNNWSPNKKGPVSPPPIQQQMGPSFNMTGMQMYNDGYNNYQQPIAYGQNQSYSYDYSLQTPVAPVAFNAYVPPPTMQPVPPGDDFQTTTWNVPQAVMPPIQLQQQQMPPVQPVESEEEKQKRIAAVDKEKKNQRATLRKQREDYKRRSTALKRELNILKEQRDDLLSGQEPPSPTTKGFLKENDRLQLQIENKISTIENVIDMLTGIIGNEKSPSPAPLSPVAVKNATKPRSPSAKSDNDSSPERLKTKVIESLKKNKTEPKGRDSADDTKHSVTNEKPTVKPDSHSSRPPDVDVTKRINFVHYDPEMHWCKLCQDFPKTAKDYLTHLHSKDHLEKQKSIESPWHDKPQNDEMPTYPDGQTKRTPIRGLQFFVPTTGWYCKLCAIWMGDLHCASLHLKSQTHALQYHEYTNQNPHFEIDWMSDRQKSYENKRETAEIALHPSSTESGIILDSIPLQIQLAPKKPVAAVAIVNSSTPATADADSDERKKKKKKKEDRKDKKKKKRSKKRKHSSSSSSSSDSSDSEADAPSSDKNKEDSSHSIRVAMRNLLKQQNEKSQMAENASGKWTVVQPAQFTAPAPPPPTISANGAASDKKDDLMMSQWNAPESIITDKEKKMLEDLKGRLKTRSDDRGASSGATAAKPERERGASRERRRTRSRSRSRDRIDRRGRRSRSRGGRRSKSRSRSPGRWGGTRRRSRSRSHGRRIEKPIVRYPEFRPRVPEKDKKKSKADTDASDGKNDKKSSSSASKKTTSSTKKLPFIGRMPVFKKQTNEEEARRDEPPPIADKQLYAPSMQPVPLPVAYPYDGMHQMAHEDYDDLMPDPMQFVSLMGAPPPPPMVPPPQQRADKNEPVLPPGIDEADADLVLKPISDAPLPRKGPLPQDFQDALSIIFPGEKKPDAPGADVQTFGGETQAVASGVASDQYATDPTAGAVNALGQHEMHTPASLHDDHSQLSMDMFAAFTAANDVPSMNNQTDMSFAEDVDVPSVLGAAHDLPLQQQVDAAIEKETDEAAEKKKSRMDELMDLAMLGIDADDLAAQCM